MEVSCEYAVCVRTLENRQKQAAIYDVPEAFNCLNLSIQSLMPSRTKVGFDSSTANTRGGVRAPRARRLQRRAFVCANSAAEEFGLRASEWKPLSVGALPQPNLLLCAVVLSRSPPSPLIHRDRPGLVDSVISPAPFLSRGVLVARQ